MITESRELVEKTMSPILTIIVGILKPLFAVLSPVVRDLASKWLKDWKEAAAKTESPWDDMICEALMSLFGIT